MVAKPRKRPSRTDTTGTPTGTITICALGTDPLYLPDNVIGRCDGCGRRVQYRPHAPKGPKVCLDCARSMLTPDDRIVTSEAMIRDFYQYVEKQKQ